MAQQASLVKWLMFSGARDTYGNPVSSGSIHFYLPGSTSQEVLAYADPGGLTVITQPVTLDAGGKAVVYLFTPAEIVVKDAAGQQVALSTRGESIAAGEVDCVWATADTHLDAVLTLIEAALAAAAPGVVAAESINTVVVTTVNPSFEFDPSKTVNNFVGSYGATSATFTIAWPSPAPELIRGTKYRLVLRGNDVGGGATSATLVVFPTQIETGTPPTSMLTGTTYSAEFLANQFDHLLQVTPWVAAMSEYL